MFVKIEELYESVTIAILFQEITYVKEHEGYIQMEKQCLKCKWNENVHHVHVQKYNAHVMFCTDCDSFEDDYNISVGYAG